MSASAVSTFPLHKHAAPAAAGAGCPLREGTLTLDALLAALGRDPGAGAALDLALELRYAFHVTRDAGVCAALAQQLGGALGESHYLAFYRVRLWLARALVVEIRAHRGEAWTRHPLPFASTAGRRDWTVACVHRWAEAAPARSAALAQVRFVFTPAHATPATLAHD